MVSHYKCTEKGAYQFKKRKFAPIEACDKTYISHDDVAGVLNEEYPEGKCMKITSRDQISNSDSGIVPSHPLHIKPLGNLYGSKIPNIRKGSGFLAILPDELILQLLEWLEAKELNQLGATCKTLYAFTRSDDLWKTLCVDTPPSPLKWRGTWRSSYLKLDPSRLSQISCQGLFSDALYRPFFCAHTPLNTFAANIPAQNEITRLSDLTLDDFTKHWADKPFILTSPVKEWPIYQTWSTSSFLAKHASTAFRAEAVTWPLELYMSYMQHNSDESPLYLFDLSFVEKMSLRVSDIPSSHHDYWPPACFGPDLFSALGPSRPSSRWLILGPARSGSTFHKDPNGTSAWNAVLRGSKYWILFPSAPEIPPPPGVFVSSDQSEVTSPLSIAEWLLGFHAAARATTGCIEGVCAEGEVLHVPSGWFHLVLNLEESVALTQNFVPRARLASVLAFLQDRPGQVSGFEESVLDAYALFVEKMREKWPELLKEGLAELERGKGKTAWEELTDGDAKQEGGFSFGFGGGDEDDED